MPRQKVVNTYCVGDVQGCFDELKSLLDAVNFDPAKDRLVLLGDLINRGPKSLETLRFCESLGESLAAVLGNHDLSILARIYSGDEQRLNRTARQILDAADGSELLNWLRHQPLALLDTSCGEAILMVHAGLPPQWSIEQCLQLANEVEQQLQTHPEAFFQHMYGDEPAQWHDELTGYERLRFITNCLTRLRYCDADGRLALEYKNKHGEPFVDDSERHLLPWFSVADRRSSGHPILFGHWSALARYYWPQFQVWGLDTGCVWGQRLTALHLQSRRIIQAPAHQT